MQKKIKNIFFDIERIPFDLFSLNTRFYWDRTLVIGCKYVDKQSQDFRYF